MARKIENDETKAPTIPQVGEVLNDLDGWKSDENAEPGELVDHEMDCGCTDCNENGNLY